MENIIESKKILDGFTNGTHEENEALQALQDLQPVSITIQILKDTKIGESIGKIVVSKKGAEAYPVALALQNAWKEAAKKESESKKRKREEAEPKEETDAKRVKVEEPIAPAPVPAASEAEVKPEVKSEAPTESEEPLPFDIPVTFAPKPFVPTVGVTTRDNVQTKFYNALLVGEQFGELEPNYLAVDIEKQLFESKGGANKDYTAAFRSLYSNLNDPLNSGLRHALLCGVLPAAQFVRMSYDELANPSVREQRQDMEKKALEARRDDAKRQGATCTVFTCSKCKNNKTTYYQLQTRSSDEPMTTFVTCVVCGNRWKF